MKLKAISTLFKKNKHIYIYTDKDGDQWISNGEAVYSMRGMPRLSPETVLRIFDVPPDKYSEWYKSEEDLPVGLDFSDCPKFEKSIEPGKMLIDWEGRRYLYFQDGGNIFTFREEYVKPLDDEPDYITFSKRTVKGGGFVLAVKNGTELKAIICPALLHLNKEFTDEINRVHGLYKTMNLNSVLDAAEFLFRSPEEQADKEPGEITDDPRQEEL